MVTYLENYGPYIPLVQNGYMDIDVASYNKDNYEDYFNGILNILRDGIEQEDVQALKLGIHLADGEFIVFTIEDYFFNILFWNAPISRGIPITTKFLIDTRSFTKKTIKKYFDMFIRRYYESTSFIRLNNLIDDTICNLARVDEFSMFLANTVNFKDTIELMKKYPDFNASIHLDVSGVPIEDVKDVGMKAANLQIKYIKENDHSLTDSFNAKEAINDKQYKEVSANIGTKPDGRGSVFPYVINNSFINGGVSTPESYVIDSATGRTAQILQKMNVGTSGAFARLLETNNLDTFFHEDPTYICNTKNFIEVIIKDESWLSMYDKRYYRYEPNGEEYLLDKYTDKHLIGKTLYFRSPITCASYARGQGICRRCYGKLDWANENINPGKMAAELLSADLTQMLLSAKHLLESSVVEMNWTEGFYDIFEVNLNMISIQEDIDTTGMYMIINSDSITNDEEEDDDESGLEYDEYIPTFDIMYPDGTIVSMHTSEEDNIYLTEDLNRTIRSKAKTIEKDGDYIIPLDSLKKIPVVFTVKIQNRELKRTLERIKHIINRNQDTSSFTKDEIVREFITTSVEGNIHLQAIHFEVIIANQMRDPDDILEMPNWSIPNCPYKILTLGSSLTNSPSITVTLEYQKIAKTLVNPLSYNKKKPSIFDVFFMEKPQDYVVNKDMISDDYNYEEDHDNDNTMVDAVRFADKEVDDSNQ